MKNSLLAVMLLCVSTFLCSAQKKTDYVHFGIGVDYFVLNDKTVGDVAMKGLLAGATLGYDRSSDICSWGVGLTGGFGFMNTYNFPSIKNRASDSYQLAIEGYYLHRIAKNSQRWQLYLGAKADFYFYANQISSFSNSEANYFVHSGLGPSFRAEYPFRIWKKDWSLRMGVDMDLAAVVVRPSYVLPFEDNKVKNVSFATLNDYGNYSTRISMFHSTDKGNAMEIVYRWRYDFNTSQNAVRHAMHSISYILYFNI